MTNHYNTSEQKTCYRQSFQGIKNRNAHILKVLFYKLRLSVQYIILTYFSQEAEMCRARIRFVSLYTPLETVLQKAILNYIHSIFIEKIKGKH